jgi:hypothetical protein
MMKLMKYELLRRKQLLIGAALSILFAEGLALFGIYRGGGWDVLAIVMTVLLVVGGLVLTFLDAVAKTYSDFKQKHGYMIFMTPQSGHSVIWAKTVFAILEMVAAGLLIAGCLVLSGLAADHVYNGVISKIFASLEFGTGFLIGCGGLVLLELIAQLSIALLAITVSRSMMQSNSYSWLIALIMYFALALIVNIVNGVLLLVFGVIGDFMSIANDAVVINSGLFTKYFIIGAVTYTAWFAGCTVLSGCLINRGIDM